MLAISPWTDCSLSDNTVDGASAVERRPRLGRGRTALRTASRSPLRAGDLPGDLQQSQIDEYGISSFKKCILHGTTYVLQITRQETSDV
jgi:hypothetical protein